MKGAGAISEVRALNERDVRVSIRSDESGAIHEFVMTDNALETLVSQAKYAKWYFMLNDFYGFPVVFDTETRLLEVGEED